MKLKFLLTVLLCALAGSPPFANAAPATGKPAAGKPAAANAVPAAKPAAGKPAVPAAGKPAGKPEQKKSPPLPQTRDSVFSEDAEGISPLVVDWLTDFDDAKRLAAKNGKDILVAFVSMDSSVWSRRLDTGVFASPAFAAAIAPSFVCVILEFPRTYSLPSAEQKKNEQLRRAWAISTFPTLFLADKTGRPYAVTGFRDSDAAGYALHLNALRDIRSRRDINLAAAARAATDSERATLMAQALEGLDENILIRHYRAELATLRKIDPQDSTGLLVKTEFMPKLRHLGDVVTRLIRQKKDFNGALEVIDKFVLRYAPTGEHLQRTLFLKLLVYGNRDVRNHAAVVKLMDTIIAVAPDSEQGKMAADARKRALALLAAKAAEEKQAAGTAKPSETPTASDTSGAGARPPQRR
jgi:hypothetical protein